MVHLDYPTTLRVAEQRVGRIVRMNSRHDQIQTWWPVDPDEFKLRTIELIHRRHEESASLLGGNLDLPVDKPDELDVVADTREFIERERSLSDEDSWEGIAAALDPVRRLVTGHDALVPPSIYSAYRTAYDTVRARVSLVPAQAPWAFFAIEAPGTGAPRWMLLEGDRDHPHIQIEEIARRLRELLGDNPESVGLNDNWDHRLESFLRKAARAERELLPRKLQRALDQMHETCRYWAGQQRLSGQHEAAERWEAVAALSRADLDDDPGHPSVDLYQVATLWLQLVQPYRAEARTDRTVRARRYSLLSDINMLLKATPLSLDSAEAAFEHVQQGRPLDRRITSCILGIPS
jgi:hypothetical protein